jgi:hypothetical protein
MKIAVPMMLVVVLAVPAFAQEAVSGGHALDNNLMVGSGGVNQAAPTYDFNYQNNVVTGNVGGLDRLHVNVPYRTGGEYSRDLGSNRLFRFQSQSVPTGPTQLYGGQGQSVYRSSQSATIDQLRGASSGSYLIPQDAGSIGGYQQLTPQGPLDPDRLEPGTSMQQRGRMLEMNASPLMGVRVYERPSYGGADPAANRDNPTFNAVPELNQSYDDNLQATPGVPQGQTPDEPVSYGNDHQLQPHQIGDDVTTIERQLEILKARLDTAGDAMHAERGQDVYRRLLDEVDKNRRESESLRVAPDDRMVPQPQDELDDDQPRQPGAPRPAPPMPGEQFDAPPQPGQPLRDDNQSEQSPMAQTPRDGWFLPQAMNPVPAEQDAAGAQPVDDMALDELADAVDYELPPLATFAAPTDDDVNNMLRTAEREMVAGRYFDAESTYRTVIGLRPGHPMARLGQINAQIGIGMVRSAAYNLRRLYLDHPELIAARFEPNLLPAPDRISWVRSELSAIMDHNPADAGLMTAYLAYQNGDMADVRDAIDEALKYQPRDPVLLLLQRVWLRPRGSHS